MLGMFNFTKSRRRSRAWSPHPSIRRGRPPASRSAPAELTGARSPPTPATRFATITGARAAPPPAAHAPTPPRRRGPTFDRRRARSSPPPAPHRRKLGAGMDRADVLVVGGGIVGLATARGPCCARIPGRSVVVVEKEGSVGAHQSGRNSGVIHAGVYYQPGSDKARLCTAGRISMVRVLPGARHRPRGVRQGRGRARRRRPAAARRARTALRARTACAPRWSGPSGCASSSRTSPASPRCTCSTPGSSTTPTCAARSRPRSSTPASTIRLGARGVVGDGDARRGSSSRRRGGPIEAQRVVTCAGLHADEVARAISGPDGQRRHARHRVPRRVPRARAVARAPRARPRVPGARPAVPVPRRAPHPRHRRPRARRTERRARVRARGLHVAPRRRATTCARRSRSRASGGSPARNWRFGVDEMARSLSRRRFTARGAASRAGDRARRPRARAGGRARAGDRRRRRARRRLRDPHGRAAPCTC